MTETPKASLSQTVVVVSHLAHGSSLFKELFASKGWKVELMVNSIEKLITAVQNTKIGMIVIDDTREDPCGVLIRRLVTYPWFHFIPVVCFTLPRNILDQSFLEIFPMVYAAEKPINKSKFDLIFTKIMRHRNKRSYAKAFASIDIIFLRPVGLAQTLSHLKTLEGYEEIKKSVLGAMVVILLEHQMFSVAESLLAKELKNYDRDAFLLFLLILTYTKGGLFYQSFQLLKNLMVLLRDPPSLCLDQAQIKILLDEPMEALSFLEKLIQWDYHASFAQPAMANIYMSMEKPELAQGALKDFPGFFKKLQLSWMEHKKQALTASSVQNKK